MSQASVLPKLVDTDPDVLAALAGVITYTAAGKAKKKYKVKARGKAVIKKAAAGRVIHKKRASVA